MLRLIVFWERLTGAWLRRLKVSLVRGAGVVRVRLMLTMGTAGSVSSAFLGWRHSSSCPATTQSNLREGAAATTAVAWLCLMMAESLASSLSVSPWPD